MPSLSLTLLLVLAWSQPQAQDTERSFGHFLWEVRGLEQPHDAAIDAEGRIYVTEAGAHRVSVFDAHGKLLRRWGGLGSAAGELHTPRGIELADDGTVYVSEAGNHRIQSFTAEGQPLALSGRLGSAPGDLHTPGGLALRAGRLYVADTKNDRISVFDAPSLESTGVLGARGSGQREFRRPLDLTFGPKGSLFVVDSDNSRIQRLDLDGSQPLEWGDWGGYRGQLDEPSGIAVHGTRVYVADRGNHRVQVFDSVGTFDYQWGVHALLPREGAGKVHYPNQIALSADGSLAVLCESFEDRIQAFRRIDPENDPAPLPPPGSAAKGGAAHFGRDGDARSGLTVLLEPETHSVVVYENRHSPPIAITRFGGHGRGHGALVRPAAVELDGETLEVLVSDAGNRRLTAYRLAYAADGPLRFDPRMGRFARSLDFGKLGRDLCGQRLEWIVEPGALARHPSGDIYLLDTQNDSLLVLTPDLVPRRIFAGHGTQAGRLRAPSDLAISPDGERIYVVDSGNRRVQAFDPDGRALFAWGSPGVGQRQFARPFGVHVDRAGRVHVSDAGMHRIQVFDAQGGFLSSWGRRGLGRMQFEKPGGIFADDRSGRLTVIDYGNHRAQRFTPEHEYFDVFGASWFVKPARNQR